MGDPERLYIGGVGSLYRVQSHKGSWDDDKIEGEGQSIEKCQTIAIHVFFFTFCFRGIHVI